MTPASKELQTLTEPIYHASRMCSGLFDECIDEMHNSSESYLIVEELRGRFRRWAAYVGAFAVPKASLDARLASHETIKEMVLDLIYMLQQNLRWGTCGPRSSVLISGANTMQRKVNVQTK